MALFGSKTKKTEKVVAEKTVKKSKAVKAVAVKETSGAATSMFNGVILRPRITEKAGIANESFNVYTFEVTKNSTKGTIAKAVKSLYKVTPAKIRTVNLPAKNVFVRGHRGTQSAVKKAMVYLKKGDKIAME